MRKTLLFFHNNKKDGRRFSSLSFLFPLSSFPSSLFSLPPFPSFLFHLVNSLNTQTFVTHLTSIHQFSQPPVLCVFTPSPSHRHHFSLIIPAFRYYRHRYYWYRQTSFRLSLRRVIECRTTSTTIAIIGSCVLSVKSTNSSHVGK